MLSKSPTKKEGALFAGASALLTEQRSSWGGGAVSLVAGQGRFFLSPELRDSNWNVHLPLSSFNACRWLGVCYRAVPTQ